MYNPAQFPLRSFAASPFQDLAFDEERPDFKLPRNYTDRSSSPILTPTTYLRQLHVEEYPIPNAGFHLTPHPWLANQVHSTALSTPIDVYQQTQYNPTVWRPTGVETVLGSSLTQSSSRTMNVTYRDGMMSASHSAHDLGPDSHPAFDPLGTKWPRALDSHLFPPFIEEETWSLGHHLPHDPNAFQSLPLSSHTTHSHHLSTPNNQTATGPHISHQIPSHHSSNVSSFHLCPHQSTANLEPDPRFRLVLPQESGTSSHRRRGARAIKFCGLWVDEEELLKGLAEPNGMLNVHQCHLEEDHSPCHLWIKGDKSSINAHIQKWHGGKPGGDKLEFACRWSACGKAMLKESIARHVVRKHLGEMWECQGCGKEVTRNDAYARHAAESNLVACQTAGALVTYTADVQVIDARAALDSGERMRYADA